MSKKHSNPTPAELAALAKGIKTPTAAPRLKGGLKDTSIPELARIGKHISAPSHAPAFKGHVANFGTPTDLLQLVKKIKAPSQAPILP